MNFPKKNQGCDFWGVWSGARYWRDKQNIIQFYNMMRSLDKASAWGPTIQGPCHTGYSGVGIPIGDTPDSSQYTSCAYVRFCSIFITY